MSERAPNSNRAILLTGLALIVPLAVFEWTSLDLRVQDRLYDPIRGWCVDRDARVPKLIFYDAPKVAIALIAVILLGWVSIPASWSTRPRFSRRDAGFVLVCIALTVLTAGLLKETTGVFNPYNIERYGGKQPYRKLLESIPHVEGRERGHGFPAAHCSGGFALMSLYFVMRGRAARWAGLGLGLAAGWSVGIYQMLKGAHYLSHTVATMILAWLLILVVSRVFQRPL